MNINEFYDVIYEIIAVSNIKNLASKCDGVDNTIYVELNCGKEFAVQIQELNKEALDLDALKCCPYIRKEVDKISSRVSKRSISLL